MGKKNKKKNKKNKKSLRSKLKLKSSAAEKDALQPLDIEDELEADVVSEEEEILVEQVEDLRGELKSNLPEAEEFLSFEKAVADREGDDDDSPGRFPNSPRFLIRFGIILTAVSVVIVLGLLLFLRIEVPSLVGMTAVEASETLIEVGLDFEIFEEERADIPAGQVIATTPPAGDYALWGTTVALRVAAEGNYAAVPSNLRAMSLEEATMALTESRLTAEVVRTFDSSVPQNSVVGFLPVRDTQLPVGSSVTLLISSGVLETQIEVPDVRNLTEDAARRLLEDVGLNPVFYYASTTRGRMNHVAGQTPAAENVVSPGSTVLVMISMGNSTTDHPIPELGGFSEETAFAMVEQAGFAAESFRMSSANVAAGTVITQMPPSQDALLRSGERMGFLVSVGEQTNSIMPNVLGMSSDEAKEMIREAGFVPVLVIAPELRDSPDRGEHTGIAVQQFPQGGSQYHIGLPALVYMSLRD